MPRLWPARLFDNLIADNGRGILASGKAANARFINHAIADHRATAIAI